MSIFTGYVDVHTGWARRLPAPWLPDALIVWSSQQTADGFVGPNNGAMSFGLAARLPSLHQVCSGLGSFPIPIFGTGNDGSRRTATDRILVLGRGGDISSANTGIRVDSWDNCGIAVTELNTSPFRAHYMAIAGATLKASAGAITVPSGGASVSVTGLDFDPAHPSILIMVTSFGTAGANEGILNIGFSDGPGNEFNSILWCPYNSWGFFSDDGSSLLGVGSTHHLSLASWDADGFTVTQPTPRGITYVAGYLLLNDIDGAFDVGAFSAPNGPGHESVGLYPQAVLYHNRRIGLETTGASMSIGALGNLRAESVAMGGNNDVASRIWTGMRSQDDSLHDYSGITGLQVSALRPGPITLDGFDTDGFTSGFESTVKYAAMRTSNPGLPSRCKQPQIWRY